MSYKALYRTFRPLVFSDVIGQEHITDTLKNQIQTGKVAHAYLFSGGRGSGKTSTAKILARAVNCLNPKNGEPCNECEICKAAIEGSLTDISEIDAASNNGVDNIRDIREEVEYVPTNSKYRVYIIDEVHMLSQQAFNAFLKTLEEPPSYAIFILCTTEKHKIIPTILSRCQTYDFNRISVPDIMRNLRSIAEKENVKIGDDSLHVIARKADGAMRDALTIFDQTIAFCGTDVKYSDVLKNLNVLDYDYSFKLVDAALAGDYATVLLIIDEVLAKGFNSLYFVVSVGEHLRDLLVSRTGGLEALLDFPENLKERYRKQAESCSVDFLYNALNCISACEAGFKSAANQRLFIEFGLMKLCFINHKPSAQAAAPAPQPAQAPAPQQTPAPQQAPVQAPDPQPAPASQPSVKAPEGLAEKASELQPKPAGRQRRSSASLSLNSLATESKAASAGTDVETMPDGEIPGEQEMERVWKNIITMCQSNPVSSRLAGIFSSAPYEVGESDGLRTLTIKVESESTKKWLEDKFVLRMENKMKEGLASQKVRFIVEVLPQEEFKPIIYMPADKAKKLMVDNPEVGNLVTDLELDS